MYFVCTKIATFAHNLTLGCSCQQLRALGFFVLVFCFVAFLCIYVDLFFFLPSFPSSLPPSLLLSFPFSLHLCSACHQATQNTTREALEHLCSTLEGCSLHITVADRKGHACSLLLNQQRTFCSGFVSFCFCSHQFYFLKFSSSPHRTNASAADSNVRKLLKMFYFIQLALTILVEVLGNLSSSCGIDSLKGIANNLQSPILCGLLL